MNETGSFSSNIAKEINHSLAKGALLPGLRVLFMSGYSEDVGVRQGVELAGVNFLPSRSAWLPCVESGCGAVV